MSAEGWGDYRSRTVQLIQNKINEGIQILGRAQQIKHNSLAIITQSQGNCGMGHSYAQIYPQVVIHDL